MKNLYKKISAVLLAGALLVGGSLSSGSMVHASSKDLMKEYYIEQVYKIVNDKDLLDGYEKMGEEIEDAAHKLKSKYKFRKFYYAAAPNDYIENLCNEALKKELKIKDYCIQDLYKCFFDPYELVDFMLGNKLYHNRPYLAKIIGNDGNIYKFIVYVMD